MPIGVSFVSVFALGSVSGAHQSPASMGLATYIGLCGIILRIQRVEILIETSLGRDPGIDGAAHPFCDGRDHAVVSTRVSSLRPKKRGPFHLVPVIAKATLDRLS